MKTARERVWELGGVTTGDGHLVARAADVIAALEAHAQEAVQAALREGLHDCDDRDVADVGAAREYIEKEGLWRPSFLTGLLRVIDRQSARVAALCHDSTAYADGRRAGWVDAREAAARLAGGHAAALRRVVPADDGAAATARWLAGQIEDMEPPA